MLSFPSLPTALYILTATSFSPLVLLAGLTRDGGGGEGGLEMARYTFRAEQGRLIDEREMGGLATQAEKRVGKRHTFSCTSRTDFYLYCTPHTTPFYSSVRTTVTLAHFHFPPNPFFPVWALISLVPLKGLS